MLVHEEYELPTKLGTINIVPTGMTTARVNCDQADKCLLIRGVTVSVSVPLEFERGEWRTAMGNRGPLIWTVRPLGVAPKEASVPQIRDAKNAVLEAVTRVHGEHPEWFIAAERRSLREELASARRAVERATESLDNAETARECVSRLVDDFEAVYPPGEACPAPLPDDRRQGVRMLSSGLINTPGMLVYLKTAFATGDRAVAIRSMMDGYSLSRWEAIGVLNGSIPTKNVGDAVEFLSPYREAQ